MAAKKDEYDFGRIATRLLEVDHVKIWEEFVRRVWVRAGYEIPVAEIVRAYFGFEELKHLTDADRNYIRESVKHPDHKHHTGRKKGDD